MDILFSGFFIRVLFECTIYNLPATVTIEITETSIYVVLSTVNRRNSPRCILHQSALVKTSLLKASVTPASSSFECFFHQKHEMNSSDFFTACTEGTIFYHSQSHPCGPGPCVGNKGSGWPGNWFECTAG